MPVTKVTFPVQTAGMTWTANKANDLRDNINNNADELIILQTKVSEIETQAFSGIAYQTKTTGVTLEANVLNIWNSAITSLSVSIGTAEQDRPSEYMMQFVVSGNAFTLTLPNTVRWIETPVWSNGYTYQVSILNNLAIYAGWEAASV